MPKPVLESLMKVGFYGRIGTLFGGTADVTVPIEGLTVMALRRLLADQYETDAVLDRTIRAAVNDEIVRDTHRVYPSDAVEFLSPLSGG